jgi:hypothetical protein
MPKHVDQKKPALSRADRRALDLFEAAQQQYQRYQELHDLTEVVNKQESTDPPIPDWHSPLTLVIRS